MKKALLFITSLLVLTSCGGAKKVDPSKEPTPTPTHSIDKLDFIGVSFDDLSVTYDGKSHILEEVKTVPEGTDVKYVGRESHIDVGSYESTATLSKEGYNDLTLSAVLTINPATFVGIAFEDLEVDYDGKSHSVYCSNVPENATVTYENNGQINVGEYIVKARISAPNYQELVKTATLKIKPIDFKNITFEDLTVTYDGEEHEIVCKNVPSFATVNYTNNKGTEPGTYNATAVISAPNYNSKTLKATLTIEEVTYDLGLTPTLTTDGKFIKYGLYPQTHVSNSSLIEKLNKLGTSAIGANHWYYYQNCYYAKVAADPYYYSLTYSDGSSIVKGETAWFRCEPILWRILSNSNGYFLMSEMTLDKMYYTTHSSSYEDENGKYVSISNYYHSDIRTWLNDDFFNSTFALNNEYVLTTAVDNSHATCDGTNTWNASPDTEDKVFLPSYKDMTTFTYGFPTNVNESELRTSKATDYAMAKNCYAYENEPYLHNSMYWTRSPESDNRTFVSSIKWNGSITSTRADSNSGVRPCITLDSNFSGK